MILYLNTRTNKYADIYFLCACTNQDVLFSKKKKKKIFIRFNKRFIFLSVCDSIITNAVFFLDVRD